MTKNIKSQCGFLCERPSFFHERPTFALLLAYYQRTTSRNVKSLYLFEILSNAHNIPTRARIDILFRILFRFIAVSQLAGKRCRCCISRKTVQCTYRISVASTAYISCPRCSKRCRISKNTGIIKSSMSLVIGQYLYVY